MNTIYFDNSATTSICPEASEAMVNAIDCYGNPSSKHIKGLDSRRNIDKAREQVGKALGLIRPKANELVFTSCGTESNNLALLGTVYAKERRTGNRIITTDSEHPSVDNALRKLEKDGFEVVRLSTKNGVIDAEYFESVLDDNTILVSLMMVNNETGAVYDVKKLFEMVKKKAPSAVIHCDAVQGFLKCPFNVKSLKADLISISGHKVHGPKGIAALYVSPELIKAKKIVPYLIGGGQENGLRSGTENIVGIMGFGAAAEAGFANFHRNREIMINLRDYCTSRAIEVGAKVNIPDGERAPHIVSITLPDIKSETMLNFLSARGICVSSGSACSSHSRHISSSLIGFGVSEHDADCTIRISFCENNTSDEVDAFIAALETGIKTLVKIRK